MKDREHIKAKNFDGTDKLCEWRRVLGTAGVHVSLLQTDDDLVRDDENRRLYTLGLGTGYAVEVSAKEQSGRGGAANAADAADTADTTYSVGHVYVGN